LTRGWGFTTSRPTDARYGDDVAKYTMSEGEDLKTFVREVLQNANDAGLDNDNPVEVNFNIQTLSGDAFDEFCDAIDWESWSRHARFANDTESGRQIVRHLDQAESEGELRVLTIEDRNTHGLLGAEDADEKSFTALVRDVLFSSKSGETSGGSYGLGKAVLWLFSGLSMVVFNSNLSQPDPRDDSPRLIARTRLPTHKSDDNETVYQGHGWFGDQNDDGARPLSVWGDEAKEIAEQLRMERTTDAPGTSIMVAGFRDPTAEDSLDDDELADRIVEESLSSFWPAIYRDELSVSVETSDGTHDATIENHSEIEPFVECLRSRGSTSEELEESGDVVEAPIALDVPDKISGESTESGELALCVRMAADREKYERNTVAFVRGAGMVVEYYDRNRVVIGGQNFHGVLLGGNARKWGLEDDSPEASDKDIEDFLYAAEPPRHNEWRRTETLANTYEDGFKVGVEGIRSNVTDQLRSLIAPKVDRGSIGPKRLASRFPIGNGGIKESQSVSHHVTGETDVSFDESHEHWVFSGEIEPANSADELREVTISLNRMGEERQTNDRIPVLSVSSSTMGVRVSMAESNGVQVGRLQIPSGIPSVEFEGFSERDPRQVKTRLNVKAKLQSRGDE